MRDYGLAGSSHIYAKHDMVSHCEGLSRKSTYLCFSFVLGATLRWMRSFFARWKIQKLQGKE